MGHSRLRFWGRCALAAGIAAPVGLLGMLSTPLGRRLGWPGLMYLGRRLFRRLIGAARDAREQRDLDALAAAEEQEEEERLLLSRVPRAPRNHHTHLWGVAMSESTPGFLFDASASEMESAASAYAPDGAMHVINTLVGMPAALTSISNTFKILAEKSDEEFPLEKEVGEGLEDVYRFLRRAAEAAEEVAQVAQQVHEQDIKRHEEPRQGEGMWDTVNNQD
ncbi:hypothetical protein [Streptomyces sp. Z26]|uniref:hypothetical protein n=1 Tax=Streptomyces sp. Z26 TaxID=2500177 RepID=UPI000EF15649|nr:hypothetical protein [Streptomyces sp. Z26]RLL68389.1 hypothetical protein D7M15_17880 [Streptomyces sp. Z26]